MHWAVRVIAVFLREKRAERSSSDFRIDRSNLRELQRAELRSEELRSREFQASDEFLFAERERERVGKS